MQTVDFVRPRGRKWDVPEGAIGAGIAESDFGTAPGIRRALADAVAHDRLTYLPSTLAAEARAATARYLGERYAWNVAVEQVQIVPDVLSALRFAVERFSEPGSPVVVPVPAYSPFLRVPEELGRDVVTVPMVREGGRWTLSLDGLERALSARPATLVLCTPHNPLGAVPTADELAAIGEIVERSGSRVFSDEIHAPIVYDGRRHIPYASVNEATREHTVTATAASKGWNVPGLKSAQMILTARDDLEYWHAHDLMPTHLGSILGAVAVTQAYSPAGLRWLDGTVRALQRNRDAFVRLIHERLPAAELHTPEATYLAWLDLSGYVREDAAEVLAREARVHTIPGAEVGTRFRRCVRFNFALRDGLLEEAVDRMACALVHRDVG